MALIVSYATTTGPRYGLLVDSVVYALDADPFIAPTLTPGEALGSPDTVKLLAPVLPSKIVCVGRNYAAHAAEHAAEVPDEPMLFLKPPSAIIGPGDSILLPSGAGRIDHEAEIAVIIKTAARNVNPADALNYVLGYTCANDVSARDYQKKDGQWGRAKCFDTFCPLGPCIATDLDPSDLAIRASVNGEIKQDSRTSLMVFDVPMLVSFVSQIMTLLPGDVLLTGTPAGVSPLSDGDTVQIEIEGIGTLENPVRDSA